MSVPPGPPPINTRLPRGIEVQPTRTHIVLGEVAAERRNQDAKWGVQDHPDLLWFAILSEEVGESAQAALKLFECGDESGCGLREELVQVAAVATAWIECIDRAK